MTIETAKEWRRHAEYYRSFGFNLVPLGGDKRPVITGINQYGAPSRFRWDDWQHLKQTDKLWKGIREPAFWTDVAGLGGICGPVSDNLVCIDFDATGVADVETFLQGAGLPPDYAWTVSTPGSGFHVWILCPGLQLEKGKLNRPSLSGNGHIELRYTGHYAALPPSMHPSGNLYAWSFGEPSSLPAGVMPSTLLAAYDTITAQEDATTAKVAFNGMNGYNHTGNGASLNGGVLVGTAAASAIAPAYAETALAEESQRMRTAAPRTRNDTANRCGFSLGQLVGAGLLDEYTAEQTLVAAAMDTGLGEGEALAAVRSGMRAGMAKPRQVQVQVHMNGNGASSQDGGAYAYGFILDCPDAADLDEAPSSLAGFDALKYRAEDGGILDAWRDLYAEQWLYVTGQEHWYAWTGKQWRKDESQACQQQIQELLDEMNRQASDAARDAKKSKATAKRAGNDDALLEAALLGEAAGALVGASKRTRARVESVAGMAQAWRSAPAATMDAANLLNLSNGTLDLDTLEFREHRPSDRLTFYLDYAFDAAAECPRFLQFLGEVLVLPDSLQADPEMAMLVQEFFGYSLSNDTRHESMLWLAGEGANGKTVLITVLRSLLGPLATNVNFETLGQMGNYDLADLLGKRVALSTEAGSRRGTIAEDMIKKLVSGETIKARPIYGFPFEYRSTVKLVWAMNDKPTVTDTSKAFWRRLALVPFYRSFDGDPNKDPFLIDKLLAERSGILNWALDGLSRLRILGRFTTPRAVAAAVAEYKREANPVAQWLDECTEAGGLTLASVVYSSYADWARGNGRQVLNSTNFGKELHRLNVQKSRTNAGNVYGLSLKNSSAAAPTAEDSAEIGL
jgi:P4 family phage/plasmid primase-like protien